MINLTSSTGSSLSTPCEHENGYLLFLMPFFSFFASLFPISSAYTSAALSPFLFADAGLEDLTLTVILLSPLALTCAARLICDSASAQSAPPSAISYLHVQVPHQLLSICATNPKALIATHWSNGRASISALCFSFSSLFTSSPPSLSSSTKSFSRATNLPVSPFVSVPASS